MPGVTVGEDYTPIQVAEAFAFGDDLINASKDGSEVAHWHTAGELLDGTVWALAKLDNTIYVAGDEIESYFLMSTRHDGKSSFRVKLTNTRVVCKNTLNMANAYGTKRDFATRHTSQYQGRLEEARKILQLTTKAQAEWQKLANELLAIPVMLRTVDFGRLMDTLFPVPDNLKGLDGVNDARVNFMRVLHKDDLQNIKETGWGIVNAAADYEQHFKTIRSTNQDKIVETLFKRSFESDSKHSLVTKAKEFVLALA
jgi:phage/plasmid-like protein (TIGR03299 family)